MEFSAIKVCLLLVMIGSTVSETTFSICRYSEKGLPCTLTCSSPNKMNVIFMKTNGSLSGEGGCLVSGGCITNNPRYKASQDSNGTYLRITKLNRTEDEGEWHCEHGKNISALKHLTVYRAISVNITYDSENVTATLANLHIEKVPELVKDAFTLTAEGYCVYPNITNAVLMPGLPHHIPVIEYVPYPEKCDDGEYSVRISFKINPSDFNGNVKFWVTVKVKGVEAEFISNSSTAVNFQGCICPGICQPELCFILLLPFLVISWGIYLYFSMQKQTVPRELKCQKRTILVLLGTGTCACLVVTITLAFSLASVRDGDNKCRVSECRCPDCTCVTNSVLLGLVGLVEVILTIVICLCFTKRKRGSSTENTASAASFDDVTQGSSAASSDDVTQVSSRENGTKAASSDDVTQVSSRENGTKAASSDDDRKRPDVEYPDDGIIKINQGSSSENDAAVASCDDDNQDSSKDIGESTPFIDERALENAVQHLRTVLSKKMKKSNEGAVAAEND